MGGTVVATEVAVATVTGAEEVDGGRVVEEGTSLLLSPTLLTLTLPLPLPLPSLTSSLTSLASSLCSAGLVLISAVQKKKS